MNTTTPMKTNPGEAVLVVNDRQDQLLSMAAMLDPLGVDVVSVESGQEALRRMLQREFAVILLDVHMPGMNGFEIAEAIRQRPRSNVTPIIFVSASHHAEIDRLRGYETGAFDYVMVPVDPLILRAKVAAFLKMYRMHMEIRAQAENLAQLNAQLSERNAALKELQQSKDQLTSMVIHDLRNPLTACLGNLDLAVAQVQKAGQTPSKYLNAASESTLALLEMVNSIVDIMRMEDGQMPTRRELVDIDALIAGRQEQYRGAASTNGVTLVREDDGPVERSTTDSALLGRVLDNLVVNAIKHTRQGGTVRVRAFRLSDDGLLLAVADTGEGIPPEAIDRLFQKYGRVEGQQLGRRYDSGLGLVFCRMAVELLGGSISVVSDVGKGSTFTMVFPVRA
ncbi:MAG TPA: hybrid sensor histidine kinase/response regulator [Planctomycetota bacterium]|nr:hybrid sensor histidine kinase/response regulator [Planctomycetota bacterium]